MSDAVLRESMSVSFLDVAKEVVSAQAKCFYLSTVSLFTYCLICVFQRYTLWCRRSWWWYSRHSRLLSHLEFHSVSLKPVNDETAPQRAQNGRSESKEVVGAVWVNIAIRVDKE